MYSREELELICNKEYKHVFTIAYSYLQNRTDAEDVCQLTFLNFVRTQPIFNDDAHMKAWFTRVTINNAKNLLILSFNRKVDLISDICELEDKISIDYSHVDIDDEKRGDLYLAVCRLPAKYSEVVYLFYYEGYSVKEITDILGIKESLVTTRLERARKKLKDFL